MKRKRNEQRQYVARDYRMSITIPCQFIMIKYIFIIFIISTCLFILVYKIDLKNFIQNFMEKIFLINKEEAKKTNGFF